MLLLCWHCRSSLQTAIYEGSCNTWVPHATVAFSWCPFTGVWSVLCHPCSEPLPSLTSVAWRPCSSTNAPSSADSTGHSQPAWEHCSALLSTPAQGIQPKMLPFQMSPEALGSLQPSPEICFERKPCKNDQLLRNTTVSMQSQHTTSWNGLAGI